jgi:predicted transcriptional regulator
MGIEIKNGSLADFLTSAKDTAKEIDDGKKITKKHTIWMEPNDLSNLLKPERTRLIRTLRKKKKTKFSDLKDEMKRTATSLNNDLRLLVKYELVRTYNEPNPGHGIHKVVEPLFGNHKIEFRAEI